MSQKFDQLKTLLKTLFQHVMEKLLGSSRLA